MNVRIAEIERVARKALGQFGYTEEEAGIILDVLMYAQLRGNNQGIIKLVGQGLPKHPEAGAVEIVRETRLSALIDGQKNAGIIVLASAMEVARQKAKENGFGLVGTCNTASSTGAIGYYARKLAEAGLVGFVFSGSPPAVTPYAAYEPLFGTNPCAIGIPNGKAPLVFDMSTSAMAWYGLIEARVAGRSIPDDVAYDSDGRLTTDPARAMEGALLPFDRGYKGSGLSMVIEILTGPLVGASFAGIGDVWGNWGNLILAVGPQLLVDAAEFEENVARLVDRVKSAKRLPDVSEILIPGERGDRLAQQQLGAGEIEIEDNLYHELKSSVGEG